MRTLVKSLLTDALAGDIPAERILARSNVPDKPQLPFCVYHLESTRPTPGEGRGAPTYEIWIYDRPGSYMLIDRLIRQVRNKFFWVSDLRSADGTEHIAVIDWVTDSADLPAEEYHAITRNSTYDLIGRTA